MCPQIVGVLSGDGEHRVLAGAVFSEEEWAQYEDVERVLRAREDVQRIQTIVNLNLGELIGTESALRQAMLNRGTQRERVHLYLNLNKAFANFLSSLRLFRDHTRTRLNRIYGRNSDEATGFRSLWDKVRSESFPFGFICRFRNYVQHCGLPFDTASTSLTDPESDEKQVKVGIRRDTLLGYNRWGDLRKELTDLPEIVDVVGMVPDALKKLEKIDHDLWNLEEPRLRAAGEQLVRLAEPGFKHGAYPAIASSEVSVPGPMSIKFAPVGLLAELGLVEVRETADGPRTKLL